MAKKRFRRTNAMLGHKKCTTASFKGRVLAALHSVGLANMLAFSRRTRRYRAAYGTDGAFKEHAEIEKFVKHHKCHRSILDQEESVIQEQIDVNDAALEHARASGLFVVEDDSDAD